MKVKELQKTVNVAWSPSAMHHIMLAAGTAAQQLDASFSTAASLELYSLNLEQPGYDLKLQASVPSDHRFYKIIWGSYGNLPAGFIIGGCDDGVVKIYSGAKVLIRDSNCLISDSHKHAGPVRAMDFNPFRENNQLATGATESEIFIWDINTNTPTTLYKGQGSEDVQHVTWNKQAKDILASTFSHGCVIWNVKEKKPIHKVTNANSRVRWKATQWHPEIGTQFCIASEDDQTPIIELWDLRYLSSPLRTLQSHQRGVLSIAWNSADPDLLLSCAKDNRILCWNPNSNVVNGEVICELAQTAQWTFEVSWCPRNPSLLVGSSFDGHAAVYSLLGGQAQETYNTILDSFPGVDPLAHPLPSTAQTKVPVLTKAPKWMKRPVGASFGFGGKLIMFENQPADPERKLNPCRKVTVSQVVTQPGLIQRSSKLKATLETEQYSEFCRDKIDRSSDEHNRKIWSCVCAYFEENVTKNILELLGYDIEAINNKLNQLVPQDDVNAITESVSNVNNMLNGNVAKNRARFDNVAQEKQSMKLPSSNKFADGTFAISTSDTDDGLITQAILVGNIEAAVSLCFSSKRYADAIILSMAAGPELLARTQYKYFSEHSGALNSLINSLVSENWIEVVKNSDIKCWKEVLIGIFTHSTPQEQSTLCDTLGDRLVSCENSVLRKQAQICYICSGNLNKLVEVSDADIQEIVELIVIMRKALAFQGVGEHQIENNIATVLSQYAEMLAAEGDLEAALSYLGNSQDQRVLMLRERLLKALSYVQDQRHVARPTSQNYYDHTRRSSSAQNVYNPLQQHSLQTQTLQQPLQPTLQQPLQQPLQQTTPAQSWNATPLKPPYGTSASQFNAQPPQAYGMSPLQPSLQQTQPTMYEQYSSPHLYNQGTVTQPPPPPPPTSTANLSGSRPSSVGPQSRSRYLIDPSVKSTPSYSQSGFPLPNPYNSQQIAPVPGYPASNLPQNLPYQPQVSMMNNPYSAQGFMNNPKEPEPFKPPQPNIMPPMQNVPQAQVYDPVRTQPTSQTQTFGNENVYQLPPQPSGWNDPPIAKSSKVQQKPEFQPPIMHPLMPGQPEPNTQDNFYQEPHALYNPQYGQPMLPGAQLLNKPLEQPLQPAQPEMPARIIEPEKFKAPIPEQHVHLKTILDELRDQCYEHAKNPQIRKKIEDVSRKLEVLYDCLRENKLSQNTLQGLYTISQMIKSGDYTGCLDLHTKLVSGPDFSQIASFMPGIKVLLLSALQLNVYIG